MEPHRPSVHTTWASRHPVTVFYLLAFAISWTGYLPLYASHHGSVFFANKGWLALLILPGMGPALAAWIAARLAHDTDSGLDRLRASLSVPVGWAWWATALMAPIGLIAIANGLSLRFYPGGLAEDATSSPGQMAAVLVVSLSANFWEEVGWRGFALPRLQRRYHPLMAAGIVGVLWALWHLPLLFLPEGSMSTIPRGPWVAGTMSHSVILAWLFNSTGRNLAVVTLFHVSLNVFANVIGVRSRLLFAVVEVSAAVTVIWITRARLGYVEESTS